MVPDPVSILVCVLSGNALVYAALRCGSFPQNDEIHHYTHSALNGDVQGIIDWTHRYTNMQHHTGEHILSGLIHKEFHVDNVGFHLGYNEITADYAMDLNNDQNKRIEALGNSVIFANKHVKTYN